MIGKLQKTNARLKMDSDRDNFRRPGSDNLPNDNTDKPEWNHFFVIDWFIQEFRFFRNAWWLDAFTFGWSTEEIQARQIVVGVALALFPLVWFEMSVLRIFGFGGITRFYVGLITELGPGFWAASRLSFALWPEFMKKADEKAAKRKSATSKPPAE
jgi:hypothetical protein